MGHSRINPNPTLTRLLVEKLGVFKQSPMVICDVGARGGVEPQWQVFGTQAQFIGFEPDQEECDRLNQTNANQDATIPQQHFYPVALGKQRETRPFSVCRYGGGSSFYPADMAFIKRFPAEHGQQLEVIKTIELATISFDEFSQQQVMPPIDFLKLDVEGCELDILQGAEQILQNGVLGLSLEVLFHDAMRHQPPFHAIDQFLQNHGFQLFDLETYRYARRTLELPTQALGNTDIGQVLWGQALYLRDGVAAARSPDRQATFDWTAHRVLKLAALMEIFTLPDCALELLQTYQTQLETTLNITVDPLMQSLAAPYASSRLATPAPDNAATPSQDTMNKPATQSANPAQSPEAQPRLKLEHLLPVPNCYARRPNFLTAEELENLRQAILHSPYLDKNQLGEGFQDSRGFSIVFTRSGMPQVMEQFPAFTPYLQRVLKSACNAFYLNPLMIPSGGQVTPHVDCSLAGYPRSMITPTLVSVLYVQVPDDLVGGELILQLGERPIAELTPETNTLLYFLGNLIHAVKPVQASTYRISLVCEQYNLAADVLDTIPEFELVWGDVAASYGPPPSHLRH
jgi:FkbM family methyltransferase